MYMSINLKNFNMTCSPMYNSQNNNEVFAYMCKTNNTEGFQNSPTVYFKCPEYWTQENEDPNNGKCSFTINNKSDTFNFGPKYGGYPINRISAKNRYFDIEKRYNLLNYWDNRVKDWTSTDPILSTSIPPVSKISVGIVPSVAEPIVPAVTKVGIVPSLAAPIVPAVTQVVPSTVTTPNMKEIASVVKVELTSLLDKLIKLL